MVLGACHKLGSKCNSLHVEENLLDLNWEEVTCPICLEFPHNGVLLECSSHKTGCRPFICDTGLSHSNCLERFKSLYGLNKESNGSPSVFRGILTCPLCRGEVTGCIIIDEARMQLNMKKRTCEEKQCPYIGNYMELQKHSKLNHPHSRPSEIDPARQLDWENFQQSSEIIDVLSTIHSEVPNGVVLGDYVIEYGSDDFGDYDDFPRVRKNWFTSCILYKVFNRFRTSRNRRRSGASATISQRNSSFGSSSVDAGSMTSPELSFHGGVRSGDERVRRNAYRQATDQQHSYRRRRHRRR